MQRQDLREKLRAYQAIDDQDRQQQQRFIEFVDTYPNCFERSLQVGHVTGSSWLVNPEGTHILLTHHRKLGKWLQLGGHADGNPQVLEVALQEAREESGINNIRALSEAIFDLDIHQIPARKNEPEHYHYDARFVLQVQGSEAYTVSSESVDLAWVPIEDLETYTDEYSMLRMRRKWQKLADTLVPSAQVK